MTIFRLTPACTSVALVLGSALCLAQPSPSPSQPQTALVAGVTQAEEPDAAKELVLRGCLTPDVVSTTGDSPGTDGARIFVLKNARSGQQNAYQQSTQAQPSASTGAVSGGESTYRLQGARDVRLRAHVGHLIEVRGRVTDLSGAGIDDSSLPVGQSSQGSQAATHGESGQRTTTPANTQAGQPVRDDLPTGIVTVTSVRMISASCDEQR